MEAVSEPLETELQFSEIVTFSFHSHHFHKGWTHNSQHAKSNGNLPHFDIQSHLKSSCFQPFQEGQPSIHKGLNPPPSPNREVL